MIELLSVLVIAGLLMAVGFAKLQDTVDRAKEVKAITDLKAMVVALNEAESLPASLAAIGWGGRLDPWGRPYVYYPFPPSNGNGNGNGNAPPQGARKDRFLVPLNSRFDLYSVGKDGATMLPLPPPPSHDDIIVANDGGFIGRGSKF